MFPQHIAGSLVADIQHHPPREIAFIGNFSRAIGAVNGPLCIVRARDTKIFQRSQETLASSLARERAAALDRQWHE